MTEKIEWYKEVLDLEPNSKIFFPLAKMLEKEGELEEARRVLAEGVSRHEEFLEARLFYISVLSRLGMDAECQRQVRILASAPGRATRNSGPRGRPAPALTAARTPPWPCAFSEFRSPGPVSPSRRFSPAVWKAWSRTWPGDSAIVPEEETAARPEWEPEGTEPAPRARMPLNRYPRQKPPRSLFPLPD